MSGRDDQSFMGFENPNSNNVGSSSTPNPLNFTPEQQQQFMLMWQQNFALTQTEQHTPPTPQTQSSQAASVEPEAISPRKQKRGGKRVSKRAKETQSSQVYDKKKNPDVSNTTLRWTSEEECLLAVCWVAVSEDKNVGVSQKSITFWYRVMNEFNWKKFQNRNKDMLSSKWHTLNANCQKFEACYKRAKHLTKSGEGDTDDMRHARQF